MRRLIVLAVILAEFAAPAVAAARCAAPADQSAYEVQSLRAQMTVVAYKCSREADYNNGFVKKFQPALQANYNAVLSYFRRQYGNGGQGRMDRFVTDLANSMSQTANRQGGEYCARAGLIINELAALSTTADLVDYAAVKDMSPPGTTMCPQGAVAPARRR